jgi:hypothetical protein
MYNVVSFGSGSVENSITNSRVPDELQLDKSQPFTYYDFLKNVRGVNTAIDYNDGYLSYLQEWYVIKGETPEATRQLISNQYVNLLRDISLNYTTNEEKRFLSNIDFSSKEDLQIVIPFYSRKLKEIILHIKDHREEVKFTIDSNSIKGTNSSLEKAVFETLSQTILNDTTYNLTLSSITENLGIEIVEFIDTYSKYFNILPEPDNEPPSRELFYSSNSNVIDGDLFINFDEKLRENIFRNVFLTELGTNFTVNVDVTSLISCNPNDEFTQQLNKQCAGGITLEDKLNLQKLLIQKYIGVDYYYLSSNSIGETLSGVLFKADYPSGNLLNIRNASTQTIPSDQLTSLREFGLYFLPDKTGLLRFNTKSKQVDIDFNSIEPSTTYIFPDPDKYGNVYYSGETPIVYKITYNNEVDNISKTYMVGDSNIETQDQPYFGYYSRQQDVLTPPKDRFSIDLVELYNEGYVREWRQDIYGNQYGLFKSKLEDYFRTFDVNDSGYVKELLLNGGGFFDQFSGYDIPTEYTTFTGYFSSYAFDYYLTLRQFTPYQEFTSAGSVVSYTFYEKDGGIFTFSDGSAIPDDISSDSILLPIAQTPGYYYKTLAEGGLDSSYTRALTGTAGRQATFLSSPNYILSGGVYYDGGSFTQDNTLRGGYDYSDNTYFISDINENSVTTLSPLGSSYGNSQHSLQSIKDQLAGKLFVGDYITGYVYPLSSERGLYNTFRKYSQTIQDDVFGGNILDFNIFGDCIQIKTNNYFIIDKIVYDSTGFTRPTTSNTYHTISGADTTITNPFYIDGKIYYCLLELQNTGDLQYVVPSLYSYNITTNVETLEFPNNTTTFNDISANFTLTQTQSSDQFVKVITPRLTYNSRNMVFGLVFLSYNQNNIPYVFDYKIEGINKPFKMVSQYVYQPVDSTIIQTNTTTLTSVPSDILGPGITITGGAFKL